MSTKIENRIVGYRVAKPEEAAPAPVVTAVAADDSSNVVRMHEKLERPERLIGATYKIKPPVAEHAMYVTINDIILN